MDTVTFQGKPLHLEGKQPSKGRKPLISLWRPMI